MHSILRTFVPTVACRLLAAGWLCFGFSIGYLVPPPWVAADDARAGSLSKLREMWSQQRNGIEAITIEYIEYQGAYQFPPQSRDDVLRTFQALEYTTPDQTVRDLACAMCGVSAPVTASAYPRRRFESTGGQVRVEDGAGRGETVFDGVRLIQKAPVGPANGPKQITIGSAPGQLSPAILSVSDFRWVPTESIAESPWKVDTVDGDDWVLSLGALGSGANGGVRLELDSSTGDINSMQSVTASSQVDREIVQSRFQDVGVGFRFPMLSMKATYSPEGTLETLGIRALLKVTIGSSAQSSSFPVSASQGDLLIDHISESGRVQVASESIADVTSIPSARRRGVTVDAGWEHGHWVLFLNGVALVVIGGLLWRRRVGGSPKS